MTRRSGRILTAAALMLLLITAVLASAGHEARLVGLSLRSLAHLAGDLAMPAALAQETLEFRAVDPDSADDITITDREVRIGGRALRIKSGDIMRVGSDITIEEDQEVQGDVLAIRGDVNVDGHVEGNVVSMGGDIRLSSTARVDGDVVCMGGQLHEESGATVGGQRVTALDPEGSRRLRPDRIRIRPDWDDEGLAGNLVYYLIMLGIVWGLCKIAPGSTGTALAGLRERPAASLGLGFLVVLLTIPALIALALVVAILCITIIGIPLALIALLGYFVFLALLGLWGYTVGAAFLGEYVLKRRGETAPGLARAGVAGVLTIGAFSIGGTILGWMSVVPLVGVLSGLAKVMVILGTIVLGCMGAGAWLRSEFTTGTLGRWWRGSGNRMRRTPPSDPGAGGGMPPSGGMPPAGPSSAPSTGSAWTQASASTPAASSPAPTTSPGFSGGQTSGTSAPASPPPSYERPSGDPPATV
jgi:cytoskeletal protein CcmA (bactofilin family)